MKEKEKKECEKEENIINEETNEEEFKFKKLWNSEIW